MSPGRFFRGQKTTGANDAKRAHAHTHSARCPCTNHATAIHIIMFVTPPFIKNPPPLYYHLLPLPHHHHHPYYVRLLFSILNCVIIPQQPKGFFNKNPGGAYRYIRVLHARAHITHTGWRARARAQPIMRPFSLLIRQTCFCFKLTLVFAKTKT